MNSNRFSIISTRHLYHFWLLLLLPTAAIWAGDIGALMRSGNSRFYRRKYEEAMGFYQRAEVLAPDVLTIHYNLGNTFYKLGRYPEAIAELSLATVDKNPLRRANAFYNLGNTFFRMNQLDEAISAYQMALLANPNDRQAKENLEFCLKRKNEAPPPPDSTKENQKSEQSPQAQKQPQPKPSVMEREQAERILQAIENKEKQTQREARRPKGRRQVEKDW